MVNKAVLEAYKERKQEIQDSDMGWRERGKAVEAAREKYGVTQLDEFQYEVSQLDMDDKIIIAIMLFVAVVGLSTFAYPFDTSVIIGVLFLGFLALVTTEQGVELLKSIQDMGRQQQQGQQPTQSSSPRQICQSCGWQNPANNNYCHDCGEPLDGRA